MKNWRDDFDKEYGHLFHMWGKEVTDSLRDFIGKTLGEVIGKDEVDYADGRDAGKSFNEIRADQRERAGLTTTDEKEGMK